MKFNYQARTKTGEVQTGFVEASSREAALDLLQRAQLFVTILEETGAGPFYAKKLKLFGGVSKKDLVAFSRQLSLMFKSRISLIQSLRTLADQTKNKEFTEKIILISENIEGGGSLSQSLERFPRIFSPFFVNMVKSGEASGTLSQSLDYLADHLEREYHLASKLKGAMIYPAMIVVVAVGVVAMMMLFVIPNLSKVLLETGQELPLVTRIVIAGSNFSRHNWWIFAILLTASFIFLPRYLRTPSGKVFKDNLLLRIPVIGQFLRMIYVSRFAENLSTLVAGGLPIIRSLEITGEVVGNAVYQERIAELREEVGQGKGISGVLSRHPKEFPPLLTQMVAIGEKTGTLDKSLLDVVTFFQKEVERSVDNILSLIEPIMVIFLGLVVAGLMGSILLPLYKMTSI